MAGKTTAKPKVKKEEPDISMTYIDDILLRLGKAEDDISGVEDDISGVIETIDELGLNDLTRRVEKVEARLGIG